MPVLFLDARVGQQLFFPGRRMDGEVVYVSGRLSKRYGVTVRFADGHEVQYTVKTWFAVPLAEREKYKTQVHAQAPQVAGFKKPTPRVVKKVPRKHKPPHTLQQPPSLVDPVVFAEPIKAVVAPPSEPYGEILDIPGPPVPRPIHGAWS